MRRVYVFWFLRTAYHSFALKFIGLGALALLLRQMVSLRSVIVNTLQTGELGRMIGYIEYALAHTHASVQITFALMAILAIWTVISAVKKDFTMPTVVLSI